jgi:hypothetical protein
LLGEITLLEDFTAYVELFDEDEGIIDESWGNSTLIDIKPFGLVPKGFFVV